MNILDEIAQYAAKGQEISAALTDLGVEPAHTAATVTAVANVASGATTVASELGIGHSTGGNLVGSLLLAFQAFFPKFMPSNVQIVPVTVPPPPASVLAPSNLL